MSKAQSGAVLMGIAVLMNVAGRVLALATHNLMNVAIAGFVAVWMLASVVVGLFGLVRLVSGLVSRA